MNLTLMRHFSLRISALLFLTFICKQTVQAQFLMEMVDTTSSIGSGLFNMYNRYSNFYISGYIQPQFQIAQSKGIASYSGGNFDSLSDNRFSIRRGRIRFDYLRTDKQKRPEVLFVFQYDISERGAFVRDFWGRLYDKKYRLYSFTAGLFARPFGYEVNLGSADRESPERGRMSQTLMKVERDLGAMVSLDSKDPSNTLHYLRIDLGVFNGQGISGLPTPVTEYDSRKDIIGRIGLRSTAFGKAKKIVMSGGISGLYGGLSGKTVYYYQVDKDNGGNSYFRKDSSAENMRPRQYAGFDFQMKYLHGWGSTEFRVEYWQGLQTATATSSETPTALSATPLYTRNFNGAFIYFLQNIVNKKHQIGVKYDWYDPNTKVKGNDIGAPGTNLTPADIKYSTLGFGYISYFDTNVKLVLWYDVVNNEHTQLAGYTKDIRDNVFTCRLQFRF
jgi:hypothetical protein